MLRGKAVTRKVPHMMLYPAFTQLFTWCHAVSYLHQLVESVACLMFNDPIIPCMIVGPYSSTKLNPHSNSRLISQLCEW